MPAFAGMTGEEAAPAGEEAAPAGEEAAPAGARRSADATAPACHSSASWSPAGIAARTAFLDAGFRRHDSRGARRERPQGHDALPMQQPLPVTPAQAGVQAGSQPAPLFWMPAFAGMTGEEAAAAGEEAVPAGEEAAPAGARRSADATAPPCHSSASWSPAGAAARTACLDAGFRRHDIRGTRRARRQGHDAPPAGEEAAPTSRRCRFRARDPHS